MNAQGSAGRAAGIVGALAALLLAHGAAADDTMIVYGKRMVKPETVELEQPAVDTAGIVVALNDEIRASMGEAIRASLRDGFSALHAEIARNQGAGSDTKVALLATRAGV